MEESADRPSTREVLLDAALSVFTEQTYGGAAVAEVAKRAGMSVGTLYRYFPSKEALGNAVFQRWKGVVLQGMRPDLTGDEPLRAVFGQLWSAVFGFAEKFPEAFAFLEFQQHESYLDADSGALSRTTADEAEQFIRRGQERGEIRPGEPAMLLALVYGSMVGLIKAMRDGLKLDKAQLAAAEEAAWGLLADPGS